MHLNFGSVWVIPICMEYMKYFRIQLELEKSKFTISVKFSYPLAAPWATVTIQWLRIIPLDWADNHERPLTPPICFPYFESLSPVLKLTYADWGPGHVEGGRSYSCVYEKEQLFVGFTCRNFGTCCCQEEKLLKTITNMQSWPFCSAYLGEQQLFSGRWQSITACNSKRKCRPSILPWFTHWTTRRHRCLICP